VSSGREGSQVGMGVGQRDDSQASRLRILRKDEQ